MLKHSYWEVKEKHSSDILKTLEVSMKRHSNNVKYYGERLRTALEKDSRYGNLVEVETSPLINRIEIRLLQETFYICFDFVAIEPMFKYQSVGYLFRKISLSELMMTGNPDNTEQFVLLDRKILLSTDESQETDTGEFPSEESSSYFLDSIIGFLIRGLKSDQTDSQVI